MKRGLRNALLLVLAMVSFAFASGCGGGSSTAPQFGAPQSPPPAAESVAGRLVVRNRHVAAGALTHAAAIVFHGGPTLPAGSRIQLDPKGWRQTGRFANSTATLLVPRKTPQRVEIGFMQTSAGWHITFMESIP